MGSGMLQCAAVERFVNVVIVTVCVAAGGVFCWGVVGQVVAEGDFVVVEGGLLEWTWVSDSNKWCDG